MTKPRDDRGFTLIELMISVAIIGILAGVAIPNFLTMQMRARRTEVPALLAGVRTAEQAYYHEWDTYTVAGWVPDVLPLGQPLDFTGANLSAWRALGWLPDGKVYGRYTVELPSPGQETLGFVATGDTDLDSDGNVCRFLATGLTTPYLVYANNIY